MLHGRREFIKTYILYIRHVLFVCNEQLNNIGVLLFGQNAILLETTVIHHKKKYYVAIKLI